MPVQDENMYHSLPPINPQVSYLCEKARRQPVKCCPLLLPHKGPLRAFVNITASTNETNLFILV